MPQQIAVSKTSSPFLYGYPWDNSTGFGTRFSNPLDAAFANTDIAASATAVVLSSTNVTTNIWGSAYGYALSAAGWGTVFSTGDTVAANGIGISPNGSTVAIAYNTTLFWALTSFNSTTGYTGSYYTTSGKASSTLNRSVALSADTFVQAGNGTAANAYPWTVGAVGTRYTTPTGMPTVGYGIAINSFAVAIGHNTTPFVSAFPFVAGTGWGTKYANPSTLPTTRGVRTSMTATTVAFLQNNSPYLYVYPISAAGFGTKYSNPVTLPAAGAGVQFLTDKIAVTGGSSLSVYPWADATGFGTRYTDPVSAVGAGCSGVAFTPNPTGFTLTADTQSFALTGVAATLRPPTRMTATVATFTATGTAATLAIRSAIGSAVAVGSNGVAPTLAAYPWLSSGFGVKFTDPATLPTTSVSSISFKATALVCTHAVTPYVTAYPWSAAGFGTKFANPSPASSDFAFGGEVKLLANAAILANNSGLSAYAFSPSSGFGTKYSNTSISLALNGVAVQSDTVVASSNYTPYIVAYPWSSVTGFGSKYADPANILFGNGATAVAMSSDLIVLAANISPFYLTAYSWSAATGFGYRILPPSILAGQIQKVTLNANSTLFASYISSPYILAYPVSTSSGFGSKFTDPASLPPSAGSGITARSEAVSIGSNSSPYVSSYAWSDVTGFGAAYSAPSLAATNADVIAFREDPLAYSLSATVASFALTGNAATLTKTTTGINYTLTTTAGAYSETGQTTTLTQTLATLNNYTLTAAASSFALTGIAATPKATRKLTATLQTYALTGTETGLITARKLTAILQTYVISTTAATITSAYKVLATTQTYELTPNPATSFALSWSGYARCPRHEHINQNTEPRMPINCRRKPLSSALTMSLS